MANKNLQPAFDMKRGYPARFNGQSAQWNKTEMAITTWAQKRDASDALLATKDALDGKTDVASLMVKRIDILSGSAPAMTSKPTPPTAEEPTAAENKAFLQERNRYASGVSMIGECRDMFISVTPSSFQYVHRNTMQNGRIHEIYEALKARYKAKSSDGMM